MRRVLLTGGTGFVGANLARRLLRDGHEVHLLVRPGYASWRVEGIRADLRFHEASLSDAEAVVTAVATIRPEWVFHLAARGGYSWETDLRQIFEANVWGTLNLLEACLRYGFEVLVNTGSSSEYGFKDHAPAETEWLDPNSGYAVAKACATQLCRSTAQSRGLRIPTLRLYSVYGPYEEPRRLIPTLIRMGLENRLPPLVDPDTARDYVHVEDVVEAYLLAAGRPGPEAGAIYNVGTGVQIRLREAVEVARRVLGISAPPEWGSMPGRTWDTNVWIADNGKIERELGWKPRWSFEEGFRQTVGWFRHFASTRSGLRAAGS